MHQTYSAGGIILNNQGEILLINEGDGFWGFPKGQFLKTEEPLIAALREIQEETGFTKLQLLKELGSYQRHPIISGIEDQSEQKNITLFLFSTKQKIPLSNDENNQCAWFSYKDALEKLSHPQDKQFFMFAIVSK